MPTLTTQLLEFLMDLLGDPEATSEFLEDPERALDEAGLGDVCSADVDAIMPVILDYAPVDVESSFDREYNTGGNSGPSGGWAPDTDNWGPDGGSGDHNHDDNGGGGGGGRGHDDDDNGGGGGGRGDNDHDHDHDRDNGGHGGGRGGDDDHGHAVQQLTHIVNNYSYTSVVDDRDTINDQSVNQNIWADGDVTQLFDNEANIASGDNSVVAGDDADVDNSTDNSTDNSRDNSTNVAVGGDADVEIGNTDNSVEIEDSFQDNSDNSVEIEDSFQDNSDNSVDVDADLENVGNKTDNSDNSDNSIDVDADLQNVGNTDNSDNSTNIDAELENVGNDQSTNIDAELENIGNTDNSTEVDIDDSLNGNAVGNTANLDNVGNETDNSVNTDVEVDDSLNGNAVGNTSNLDNVGNDQSTTTDVNVEDIDAEFTSVDDSVIVQDNELDVELESETTTITEDG